MMALKKVPLSTRPCVSVQAGVGLAGIGVGVRVAVGVCVRKSVGVGLGTGVTLLVGVSGTALDVAEGVATGDATSVAVGLAGTPRTMCVGVGVGEVWLQAPRRTASSPDAYLGDGSSGRHPYHHQQSLVPPLTLFDTDGLDQITGKGRILTWVTKRQRI
jgi:hypothetical protein